MSDVDKFGELLVDEIIRVLKLHRSTITNPDMAEFVKGMEAAISIVELNFGERHETGS